MAALGAAVRRGAEVIGAAYAETVEHAATGAARSVKSVKPDEPRGGGEGREGPMGEREGGMASHRGVGTAKAERAENETRRAVLHDRAAETSVRFMTDPTELAMHDVIAGMKVVSRKKEDAVIRPDEPFAENGIIMDQVGAEVALHPKREDRDAQQQREGSEEGEEAALHSVIVPQRLAMNAEPLCYPGFASFVAVGTTDRTAVHSLVLIPW